MIRLAVEGDAQALAKLAKSTFEEAFGADNDDADMANYLESAFTSERIAQELTDESNTCFLAEISGELAGYVKLRTGEMPACVNTVNPVELERIYAERQYHGAGVGATLMDAAIEHAAQAGHDSIWLGVWEQNPRAIAFYRKRGFELVGRKTFRFGTDLQTDQVFLLHLSN